MFLQSKKQSAYYSKVRSDIRVYSSITCIVEKVELDGHLDLLGSALSSILSKEIVYAIGG